MSFLKEFKVFFSKIVPIILFLFLSHIILLYNDDLYSVLYLLFWYFVSSLELDFNSSFGEVYTAVANHINSYFSFSNLNNLALYIYIKKYLTGIFIGHTIYMYISLYFLTQIAKIVETNSISDPSYNIIIRKTNTVLYFRCMLLLLAFFNIYNVYNYSCQQLFKVYTFEFYWDNIIVDNFYLITQIVIIFLYWLYLYNQYLLKINNKISWDLNQDILLLLNIATYLNLKLIVCTNFIFFALLIESLTLLLIIVCSTIGSLKEDLKSAEEAGFKLYINNAVSSGFLLLGIGLIYGSTGTVMITDVAYILKNIYNYNTSYLFNVNYQESLLTLGLIFLLVGIFTKLMQSPFHLWAKDIYEGSSLAFTTYIATLSKMGIIFFFVNNILQFSHCIIILNICYCVGILSMLIGILGAVKQKKIKSFLAYSSIAAIAPILIVCSISNSISNLVILNGILLPYVLSYLCILFIVFILINRIGKLQIINKKWIYTELKYIYELAGLWHKNKLISLFLIITFFTLLAIPPFFNFLIKTYILLIFIKTKYIILSLIYLLYGVIASFYYLHLIKLIVFDNTNKNIVILNTDWKMILIIVFFLLFLLIFFIYPKIIILWLLSHLGIIAIPL